MATFGTLIAPEIAEFFSSFCQKKIEKEPKRGRKRTPEIGFWRCDFLKPVESSSESQGQKERRHQSFQFSVLSFQSFLFRELKTTPLPAFTEN